MFFCVGRVEAVCGGFGGGGFRLFSVIFGYFCKKTCKFRANFYTFAGNKHKGNGKYTNNS